MEPDYEDPVIAAYEAHVDVSLLRENLKLTYEERLRKLESALAFTAEIRRAGEQIRAARGE